MVELFYVVVVIWMWLNLTQGWNIIRIDGAADLLRTGHCYRRRAPVDPAQRQPRWRLDWVSESARGSTVCGGRLQEARSDSYPCWAYTGWVSCSSDFKSTGRDLEEPEDALGFGDVNLGGVIGLLLGWPGIIAGLVFAILLAGGFSLVYLLIKLLRREYRPSLAIPYGPFLAASAAWLLVFKNLGL